MKNEKTKPGNSDKKISKGKQSDEFESYLNLHTHKLIYGLFGIMFLMLAGYVYFNQDTRDTRDYSQDKNIEDDFALPPANDEKYLHFREGNRLTVVNYFSLDCPFCRKLFKIEEGFVKEFGDQVNFAFRDKPLVSQPLSYEKALIKECIYINNASSSEKYFAFTREVFEKYDYEQNLPENRGKNNWVKQLSLKYISEEQLESCLNDNNLRQKVIGFKLKADASQITWTPTIVLFQDGVEVERIEKVWVDIYRRVLEKYIQQ